MKWIIVCYQISPPEGDPKLIAATLNAFGPFAKKQDAHDYADEFGGAWNGYNVIELQKPEY